MKLLAKVLLLTVLFLAFKPGIDLLVGFGCHEVSCCADECNPFLADTNENEGSSENCDGNSCNPFQSCGNSFVYEVQLPLEDLNTTVFAQKQFLYKSSHASQFLPEFWQPPKIS